MKARAALWILLVLGLGVGWAMPVAAEEGALENPAIREILAMAEAGVGEPVILARIEQLDSWPELTGEEIATLKKMKVGDRVLLRLVELGGSPKTEPAAPEPSATPASDIAPESARPSAPPAAPVQPPAREAAAANETEPAPLLRVELDTAFAVHWVEVLVDGRRVAELGELLSGESDPGGILTHPARLRFRESRVVYEGEAEPGERQVEIGYAVTEVEADPNDEWSEYSRQRYSSAGVWASGESPEGRWTRAGSATCLVRPGATCSVIAETRREPRTRFGGEAVYDLSYRVSSGLQP